jgi:hypothetical protein
MRSPRFRLTVERLMIALVPVVAGTLVVGSISRIPSEVAQADAVVFGIALGAQVGLAFVMAVRWLRGSPHLSLRPNCVGVAILVVMAWAAVEWPFVREWSFHAMCENMYRHDPEAEVHPVERREQVALHSRLRRAYQDGMLRPWKTVVTQ